MQTAILQISAVLVLSTGAMLLYEPYRRWHCSYIPVRLLVLVLQVRPLCSVCLLKSKASHQYPALLGKHKRVSLQKGRARSLNSNIHVLPKPSIQKPKPCTFSPKTEHTPTSAGGVCRELFQSAHQVSWQLGRIPEGSRLQRLGFWVEGSRH